MNQRNAPPPRAQSSQAQSQTRTAERPQQQPAPSLTREEAIERVSGSFIDPKAINQRLTYAKRSFNLVSPAAHVGSLPPGCEVSLSVVDVDVDKETYGVGSGKFALMKSALDRVGAAIGVSWDGNGSGRVDDGSDPHYCHFKVAGHYRAFDGQVQTITANKEMDLRDGSPTCAKIEHEATTSRPPRDPRNQIREMRAHILAHAESKAKNRGIRSLGLRSSYTRDELGTPFVCARIMFTGRTEDPELRKAFALKTADAFLGGVHTLYGGAPQAQTAHAQQALHAPPPLADHSNHDDDGDDVDGSWIDGEGESVDNEHADERAEFTIPGGKAKGTPLSRASDGDLNYWATRIGAELDGGTSRDEERDGALHGGLLDEIKRREIAAAVSGNASRGPAQTELKT